MIKLHSLVSAEPADVKFAQLAAVQRTKAVDVGPPGDDPGVCISKCMSELKMPAMNKDHCFCLSVGDVDLKRRGCCSVVATDPEGLFRERWSALYRGGHVPFSPGDRVKTLGFEASVLAVSEDGLATQVEFQLGGPLGSKQFVLARWNGEDFEVVRAKTLSRTDD